MFEKTLRYLLNKAEKRDVTVNDWEDVYSFANGYEGLNNIEFKDSDYFKCINILANSIAKVPLLIKQNTVDGERIAIEHPLHDLLKNRPNPYMNAIDFFKSMQGTREHEGQSASLITRDTNYIINGLYPIKIVEILIDDVGLLKSKKIVNPIMVTYTCGKDLKTYNAKYEDILHFKGFTLDGITCTSVRAMLKTTLETSVSAKEYQKELFENGLTSKAVVQVTSDIKEEKELKKIQAKFGRLYSAKGRIITVPAGYSITPLNLNLADAEFTALKKLGTVDIATAFGVPLYMLGILEGYNNNAMEQASLSFLNDTLQEKFATIEQEGNYKLLSTADRKKGYFVQFDLTGLYKLDSKTLSGILVAEVQNGIRTPNEARKKLGLVDDPNGDELLLHSGMVPLLSSLNTLNSTPKEVSK